MFIIVIGIVGTALILHYTESSEVTIQLSEQSLKIPSNNNGIIKYSSLQSYVGNKDYVIIMQTIGCTPIGYTINSSTILSKGFKYYSSTIDLKQFIKIWENYYRKHTPYSFAVHHKDLPLPTIINLLITYLPNGKILIGEDEIDSYKLLLMMGYPLRKIRRILLNDPLYPFRHHIIWRLNITLQTVSIDEIIDNITRSVEKIVGHRLESQARTEHPVYQGVYTQVWLKDLYDRRDKPPSSWYSHIVDMNGNPAPRSVVENTWYMFATRFGQEYFFDKSSWRLSDAIKYVLLGPSYKEYSGKPVVLMSMTTFIHLLYSGSAGYRWLATPIDETIQVPILYITAGYNVPASQKYYITFSGGVIKANSTGRLMGPAIFGYIIGNMKYTLSVKNCGIDVDCVKPSRAIMAPLHLSNIDSNSPPDILVIVMADVKDVGSQWLIKPLVMFLPDLTIIDIDYNNMHEITCNDGAPPNYDKIVWGSYLETVYNNIVTKDSHDPFYTLTFASGKVSMTCYSGSIIGYYFPLIGKVLEEIGLVGQVAETHDDLMGIAEATAASNPLASIALLVAELIGNSVDIALYQASNSLVIITVYCNQHIPDNAQIPVDIEVRHGYATRSTIYKPLFVEIDITVGYVNAPPGAESYD